MISVINPIQYGDNERSRLSGIGSSGELVFNYVIRESIKLCVGSVKMTNDSDWMIHWDWVVPSWCLEVHW